MKVERTTRYVTTVDTLPDAWTFVMEHIDRLGDDPSIEISPIWIGGVAEIEDSEPWPRRFEVVVSGMIEVGE